MHVLLKRHTIALSLLPAARCVGYIDLVAGSMGSSSFDIWPLPQQHAVALAPFTSDIALATIILSFACFNIRPFNLLIME